MYRYVNRFTYFCDSCVYIQLYIEMFICLYVLSGLLCPYSKIPLNPRP